MIFIVSSKIQTLIQFSVSLTCYARRGGYGKLVQRELEAQRQLVDYGTGSLTSFQPVMPPRCKFSVPFYVDLYFREYLMQFTICLSSIFSLALICSLFIDVEYVSIYFEFGKSTKA